MRYLRAGLLVLSSLIFIQCANTEEKTVRLEDLYPQEQTVLNILSGNFNWEMQRPSDGAVLRTGSRFSLRANRWLITVSESFDESDLLGKGLFGFNPHIGRFFSVMSFNEDPGPHSLSGEFDPETRAINFMNDDGNERAMLTVVTPIEYYWTYENMNEVGEWQDRDLKIVFKRKGSP